MPNNFEAVVNGRLEKIKRVLIEKAKEYATEGNRFHNFDVAARLRNTTREKALEGMWLKHLVSVLDLISWCDGQEERITLPLINEKIGDCINYLILLEGMLIERYAQLRVHPSRNFMKGPPWVEPKANINNPSAVFLQKWNPTRQFWELQGVFPTQVEAWQAVGGRNKDYRLVDEHDNLLCSGV